MLWKERKPSERARLRGSLLQALWDASETCFLMGQLNPSSVCQLIFPGYHPITSPFIPDSHQAPAPAHLPHFALQVLQNSLTGLSWATAALPG